MTCGPSKVQTLTAVGAMKQVVQTCRIVVPGSTYTGLSSTKTSTCSGGAVLLQRAKKVEEKTLNSKKK